MNITLHDDVEELIHELNQHGPSVVFGGYLRDRCLGQPSHDVDIATNIPMEELERLYGHYEKAGKRVTISGHHVFSFKLHRREKIFVEMVSMNGDVYEKGREADYTINALIHDGHQLIDKTGTIRDMEGKWIREVDAEILKRDLTQRPFLWLKTLRLAATTGFAIADSVRQALHKHRNTVDLIPDAIRRTEGHKIMNGINPYLAMNVLAELDFISPFAKANFDREGTETMPPHHVLCYMALKTNRQTIDDWSTFSCFPNELIEKYHELYEAYHRTDRLPNRLRQHVYNLRKLIEKS